MAKKLARKKSVKPVDIGVVRSTRSERLDPDPEIVDAIANTGYSLAESLADLVDNSLDANATSIVIRLTRTENEIVRLCLADNGSGMSGSGLKKAMTFASRREYGSNDLGMYGMGLKSASLSQADSLTVFSSLKRKAVGRRWTIENARENWACQIINEDDAAAQFDESWGLDYEKGASGTIVRWDSVRDFRKSFNEVDPYITKVGKSIRDHLGLHFHRFISSERLKITIQIVNVSNPDESIEIPIFALDPFGYENSGSASYPKSFEIKLSKTSSLTAQAHIWPPRQKVQNYKLGGGNVAGRQGFYFYRNDRLLQAGGWSDLRETEPHLSLARVLVDLPKNLDESLQVRFTKTALDTQASFIAAVRNARATDGTAGWPDFIDEADRAYRTKSTPAPVSIVHASKGLAPSVRKVLEKSFAQSRNSSTVEIIWKQQRSERVFSINRSIPALILNSRYRKAISGSNSGSLNDAPTFKVMLLLLVNEALSAGHLSKKMNERITAYERVIRSTLKEKL